MGHKAGHKAGHKTGHKTGLLFMILTLAAAALAAGPVVLAAGPALAGQPSSLDDLLKTEPGETTPGNFGDEYRTAAMNDAAMAWGMQAGAAYQRWQLQQTLVRVEAQMDDIFNFGPLVIRKAGFTIMPPVIVETEQAFKVDGSGKRAASARRRFNILAPARIVSDSGILQWHAYLYRSVPEVLPPPAVLFPRDKAEAQQWRAGLREGWQLGLVFEDDVFVDDVNSLLRDYLGSVTYRVLLAQHMVSEPDIISSKTPVDGGGEIMDVSVTNIVINDDARLNPLITDWVPRVEAVY